MSKPWAYISSPYSRGDVGINTRVQMEVWDRLMNDDIVWPVAPLWSHFQHIFRPRSYQEWIDYDLALLPRLDVLLRVNAVHEPMGYRQEDSDGADIEIRRMMELDKPIHYSIESLYEWAEGWQG